MSKNKKKMAPGEMEQVKLSRQELADFKDLNRITFKIEET